jgi:hypothetical protein
MKISEVHHDETSHATTEIKKPDDYDPEIKKLKPEARRWE